MPRQHPMHVVKSANSPMVAKIPPRSNRNVVQNLHQADHTGSHHQPVQTTEAGQHIAKSDQFPPDQRQHLIVLEGYRQGRCNVPENGDSDIDILGLRIESILISLRVVEAQRPNVCFVVER